MNELEQKAREIANLIIQKGGSNYPASVAYKAALEALQLGQAEVSESGTNLNKTLLALRDAQKLNAALQERCERLEEIAKETWDLIGIGNYGAAYGVIEQALTETKAGD